MERRVGIIQYSFFAQSYFLCDKNSLDIFFGDYCWWCPRGREVPFEHGDHGAFFQVGRNPLQRLQVTRKVDKSILNCSHNIMHRKFCHERASWSRSRKFGSCNHDHCEAGGFDRVFCWTRSFIVIPLLDIRRGSLYQASMAFRDFANGYFIQYSPFSWHLGMQIILIRLCFD